MRISHIGDVLSRMEEDERVRRLLFFLILFLIGGVMLLLNLHTPLQMDDYDYSISWATGQPLSGLADILSSQAAHYQMWGGRSVVHALAQLFLYLGKDVFNVANTLMYLLLLLEIYTLARQKGRHCCAVLLLCAHLFLFYGVPFFGTVFLWLDGACNYLWGTALALLPALVLLSDENGGLFSRRAGLVPAVCMGFIAGWTNENTACGMLALVCAAMALRRLRGERIAPSIAAMALAQAAGIAVMLLAPGNFARASAYSSDAMALELVRRAAVITAYTAMYTAVPLCAALLGGALSRALGISPRTRRAGLLLFGALAAAYAMVGSPSFSDRSLTGVLVLALCGALVLLGDWEGGTRTLDAAKAAMLPLLLVVTLSGGYTALGEVKAHEAAWMQQVNKIEAAAAAAAQDVCVQSVKSHSRFTMDITLAADEQTWPNTTLSKVFGISVRGDAQDAAR